jgi:HEAT repeat protein
MVVLTPCAAPHAALAQTTTAPTSAPNPAQPATQPAVKLDDPTILQTSDNSVTPIERRFAAAHIAAARTDTARSVLLNILTTGPDDSRTAVAEALAADPWTLKDFIAPLADLLKNRDVNTVSAAAQALSQYRDSPDALSAMISAESSSPDSDIRQAIVSAMGNFTQKLAARTLVDLLNHDPDETVQAQSAAALNDMTGQTNLGHNGPKWSTWLEQNDHLSDKDFQAMIMNLRADAYSRQVFGKQRLERSSIDLLNRLYSRVPASERSATLLSYLRSPAPEIRALGASLVLSSALGSPNGAPAGTIEETRLLLADPYAEVRAAAAHALSADSDSVPAMVNQLAVEQDDFVRIQLIKSLAIFQDPAALSEILKMLTPAYTTTVRIEAASAIRIGVQGGDVFNKDPALKKSIIDALEATLPTTTGPGNQALRVAVVNALAAIKDDDLYNTFRSLLIPVEPVEVRAAALKGIGNMPGAQKATRLFDTSLSDDDEPQMRLAAEEALAEVAEPIPVLITPLVLRMSGDRDEHVKAEAWSVLQTWAQSPNIDDSDLEAMATQLHTLSAPKELFVRQQLRDRLAADMNNPNLDSAARDTAAHNLADQESDIGDLLMLPTIHQPAQAAEHFQAALTYWQKNSGTPDIINPLCDKIVRALLEAKRWDAAATFASNYIKDVGTDPDRMPTISSISREFRQAADSLVQDSTTDLTAYADATAFFAAVNKMNPKLAQNDLDQLEETRQEIQHNHETLQATTRNAQ